MSTVYLLCFDSPISDSHTARHYIGIADDLECRLQQHEKGIGARFTQVAKQRGIKFRLARTWKDGNRTLERKLKNRKNAKKLCPFCQLNAQLDKPIQ